MEILITLIIVASAIYIFAKNLKKKGCDSECSCCSNRNSCCSKNK